MMGPELLRDLWASEIFTAALPKRPLFTNAEFALLTEEEKRRAQEVGLVIKKVADAMRIAVNVREIGKLRYEPAVPALVDIWRTCPIIPVRVAAGHALFAIGTPE